MAKKSAAKIKQQALDYPIPQTRDQVVEAIAEIGRRQRERDRIQAAMNDELAAIRERYEVEALPHTETIKGLTNGVQIYCEANRDKLTAAGKSKTVAFASGEVKWRVTTPKVVVRGVETVLQTLKSLRLTRFIRTKEEINKEAILADPEAIRHVKGITISQSENFVIVPFETELEEVV
ncbi:MAG: host-nuclease inhibitor Gam family protein [Anaerolineae bacterium]|jgi:phage host-nuclease inhibitor protein Gam|nr:host-nuclease inhibitor Gam family protein [Anaerolineae bacterium]